MTAAVVAGPPRQWHARLTDLIVFLALNVDYNFVATQRGVTRGKNLSNAQGVLLDKGRKLVAGMDFFSTETFDLRIIDEIVQEAILLDELAKK